MLYKLINYKVIHEYTSFFLFGIITKGFFQQLETRNKNLRMSRGTDSIHTNKVKNNLALLTNLLDILRTVCKVYFSLVE